MRRLVPLIVLALAGNARADVTDPKPAPLVGVTEAARPAIDKGFIDDAIAFDGARLAYVNTDASTFADLVVYDVAKKAEASRVALPGDLGATVAVELVGPRVLVVGRAEDGKARAALIGADGKIARRFGPADDITLIGGPQLVLHRAKPGARGAITHELEVVELDKGKRVGKLHTLALDGGGKNAKLDLAVDHFTDGFTHAIGVQGGHWDPKENQRTPDVAADYDLIAGKVATTAIDDPMEHQRRAEVLTARPAGAPSTFVKMSHDLATVELWRNGAPAPLALDQPVAQYDPASLQGGDTWLVLEVDPTNAAAVKRKKADAQYLDLFAVDGASGKAVRKGRVLVTPKKKYATGVTKGMWWVLERSVGYDRGGTSLVVYATT